jgi:RNA polymerase sigma-70 factor (ECF subfamily)
MEPALARPRPIAEIPGVDVVVRASGGDAGAFEQLVRSRVDRLHRTAEAILGGEADARDATQEAFLAAWRQLPRLRDPGRFDAWLMQILVNACRMQLRARTRVREVAPLDDATADRPGAAYTTRSLDDDIAGTQRLARAFARLTVDQRSVLVLHHLHHLSVADIADAMGRPSGTVKWRLSQARSALQRALEAEDHD